MAKTSIVWYLAALATMPGPSVSPEQSQRTIRVAGEGRATAPPDMATIQTGVITQATKARDALDQNNAAMDRIMAALKAHKVAAKDIQTLNFNVSPEYRRGPRGQREPDIVGYRVVNQVQVRVRNLPDLGKVLDALVEVGSNEISGVSFGIDDPGGVLNQARNRAISDARSRAQLYAQAAGVRVGRVISISEQTVTVPTPLYLGRALRAEATGAVPIATGEQQLRATIQMVFALEDLE